MTPGLVLFPERFREAADRRHGGEVRRLEVEGDAGRADGVVSATKVAEDLRAFLAE